MEAVAWHSELQSKYPYIFTCKCVLQKVIVWFKASGFYYTVDAGPSLGLFLDSLLLPCVMEILQLWVCRTDPFMYSSILLMGWVLG